jgi:glycine cleavage system H protein
MTTHEFLASYDAKVLEYLIAVAYLLLFVPMWRFVHGGARAALGAAAVERAHAAPPEPVAVLPAAARLGPAPAPVVTPGASPLRLLRQDAA